MRVPLSVTVSCDQDLQEGPGRATASTSSSMDGGQAPEEMRNSSPFTVVHIPFVTIWFCFPQNVMQSMKETAKNIKIPVFRKPPPQ